MALTTSGLNQPTIVTRSKSAKTFLKRIFSIFPLDDGNSWFHCEISSDLTVYQVRSAPTQILQFFILSLPSRFISPPDEFFQDFLCWYFFKISPLLCRGFSPAEQPVVAKPNNGELFFVHLPTGGLKTRNHPAGLRVPPHWSGLPSHQASHPVRSRLAGDQHTGGPRTKSTVKKTKSDGRKILYRLFISCQNPDIKSELPCCPW